MLMILVFYFYDTTVDDKLDIQNYLIKKNDIV